MKRWRIGRQAERWLATSPALADLAFRRLPGAEHLPQPVAAASDRPFCITLCVIGRSIGQGSWWTTARRRAETRAPVWCSAGTPARSPPDRPGRGRPGPEPPSPTPQIATGGAAADLATPLLRQATAVAGPHRADRRWARQWRHTMASLVHRVSPAARTPGRVHGSDPEGGRGLWSPGASPLAGVRGAEPRELPANGTGPTPAMPVRRSPLAAPASPALRHLRSSVAPAAPLHAGVAVHVSMATPAVRLPVGTDPLLAAVRNVLLLPSDQGAHRPPPVTN